VYECVCGNECGGMQMIEREQCVPESSKTKLN